MHANRLLLPVICLSVFAGCSTGTNKAADNKRADTTHTTLPTATYDYHRMEGLYQGDFGGTNIRLVLTYISGRHATGYTLQKGLCRNFSGTMQAAVQGFSFELNEPGDNKYDGAFRFSIDTATLALAGSWKPFKAAAASPKTYTLKHTRNNRIKGDEPTAFTDTRGGRYTFDQNGLITYRTYHGSDGRETKEVQTVRGNWTLNGDTYSVDWGPNNLLPARNMKYRKVAEPDYGGEGYYYLKGGGQIIRPDEAP